MYSPEYFLIYFYIPHRLGANISSKRFFRTWCGYTHTNELATYYQEQLITGLTNILAKRNKPEEHKPCAINEVEDPR